MCSNFCDIFFTCLISFSFWFCPFLKNRIICLVLFFDFLVIYFALKKFEGGFQTDNLYIYPVLVWIYSGLCTVGFIP